MAGAVPEERTKSDRIKLAVMEHNKMQAMGLYDKWFRTLLVTEIGSLGFGCLVDWNVDRYHYAIIPLLYCLTIIVISFLLNRIWFALPLVMHAAVFYYSNLDSDGYWEYQAAKLHLLLAVMVFVNWFLKTKQHHDAINRDPDLASIYQAISTSKQTPPSRIATIHVSVVLLFLMAVTISVGPWIGLDPNLISIMPVVIVLLASVHIPGVGGNSTSGVLSILLLFVIGLMAVPPILQLVLDVLRMHLTPPRIEQVPQVNIPAQVMSIWNYAPTAQTTLAVSSVSVCDIIRNLIGYTLIGFMVCDDFNGPAHLIAGALDARGRADNKLNTRRGIAGVFESPWVLTFISTVAWNLMTGEPFAIIMSFLGVIFGWLIHIYVGADTWYTRGQASTLSGLRENMLLNFGGGASGFRRCLAFIMSISSILLLVGRYGTSTVMGSVFLTVIMQKDEKILTIICGAVTYNPGIIFTAMFSRLPLTGTVAGNSESTVDSYSPIIGSNAATTSTPIPAPRNISTPSDKIPVPAL